MEMTRVTYDVLGHHILAFESFSNVEFQPIKGQMCKFFFKSEVRYMFLAFLKGAMNRSIDSLVY